MYLFRLDYIYDVMGSVELVVWILLACTPIYTGQDNFRFRIVQIMTSVKSNIPDEGDNHIKSEVDKT